MDNSPGLAPLSRGTICCTRKSTGNNFGGAMTPPTASFPLCALSSALCPAPRSHSFSQSSSDGTATSACFAYTRCTALELWPNACCANRSGNRDQTSLLHSAPSGTRLRLFARPSRRKTPPPTGQTYGQRTDRKPQDWPAPRPRATGSATAAFRPCRRSFPPAKFRRSAELISRRLRKIPTAGKSHESRPWKFLRRLQEDSKPRPCRGQRS